MPATNRVPARKIVNFGGNIQFRPRHYYKPATEEDVLQILNAHANGSVRAIGALHSWSDVIVSGDVVVDLSAFDSVVLEQDEAGSVWATVGAGVKIEDLLVTLNASGLTLPTTPEATMQTLVGAISTGTHGSGLPSLSHFIGQVRAAAYDPHSKRAKIYEWTGGDELRAASCALGCMGIILSVRVRCSPQYSVYEVIRQYATIEEVLEGGSSYPLQEFFLTPWSWTYYAFNRRPVRRRELEEATVGARFHRAYKYGIQDILDHFLLRILVRTVDNPGLTRWFLKNLFPLSILTNREIIERSDLVLVRQHEAFRHIEMEAFVPAQYLPAALDLARVSLEVFAGVQDTPARPVAEALESIGLLEYLNEHRGTYTHHYPLFVRRVMPDDTMIAETAGAQEAYYTISLFSYTPEREAYYITAAFLANAFNRLFGARLHWGKYFPLANPDIEPLFNELPEFRRLCEQVDPRGVFRNTYARQVLGFPRPDKEPPEEEEGDIEEIDI